jgi:16S rRNA (guanine966-N2)-methyltransferase
VAGTARGVPLVAPKGRTVRPTADRVKEATFNALVSLDVVDGATVLDLFAGSGALGIEALSRGASHATFVDRSRESVEAVDLNLARTGLAARATVIQGAAATAMGRWTDTPFDLALLDPPYDHAGWAALLADVPARVVVIESDRPVDLPERLRLLRERTYGGTVVQIAELREPHS